MIILFLRAVDLFIVILMALIILGAILSWFPVGRHGKLIQLIRQFVNPFLRPIQLMIKKSIFGGSNMMIDMSPFIAYLILSTLHRSLTMYIGTNSWLNF